MENWYPKIFADVEKFNPLKGNYLYVSELITHKLKDGTQSSRDYQSLLIDSELIQFINPEEINPTTNSSVRPFYDEAYEYNGSSSVFVSNHAGLEKVHPLILSWESANNITFQPDPMFLLTYGLTPRLTEEIIYWDDLSKPMMDVVVSIPKSVYDFPEYSKSFVQIRKEYLQDYLMLKKKVLIQVYCETRILEGDPEIQELLGENKHFEKTTKYNHFRILKTLDDKYFAEVTGFREIKLGDEIPFSKWDNKKDLIWPGFKEPITRSNAKHWEYVYVSDEVLDVYEQDDNYTVCPESGSVSYKNQWSVSRTSRIGRNHIKLELFKLYEGTPFKVISYWNKFSVDISCIDLDAEHIAIKAKKLVYSYFHFGEWLSNIISYCGDQTISTEELIKLDREQLNYYGWSNHDSIKPISNHLAHKLLRESFLNRIKKLHHFLIENLVEKNLRKAATQVLGIDLNSFKQSEGEVFRSIKLLNLILNYLKIAKETGLNSKSDSKEINIRLENGLAEIELIKILSAINTLRQLDSHQTGRKLGDKMDSALKTFGIEKNEIGDNFLDACEKIYDRTELEFKNLIKDLNLLL
ncbi:hypothetical protein [Echinicola sp. 20G]|uniref:hypothetical protein n=1 Tax=Echinicola sp. 20G TaxID=2781961 RepID=UPI001910BEEB|nr:hypothetical protein [Echinicola sp. 20G]